MHASYLSKVFNRNAQDRFIGEFKRIIKEKNLEFDGLVVTGVSGITMGSIVARSLRKDLVIVRKDNDGTHSSYNVENFKRGKSYIFLDDLIASGKTFKNVKESIFFCNTKDWQYGNKKTTPNSKIIGGIFYDGLSYTTGIGINYKSIRSLNRIN